MIYFCFVPCWKNCKQYTKIHFLYRTCSNFNSIPFHHHRKNNERIWCLKPPCGKAEHEQRKGCSKRVLQNFFTMLATHTTFFLYYQELFDCFHLFHRIHHVFASDYCDVASQCGWIYWSLILRDVVYEPLQTLRDLKTLRLFPASRAEP